MDPARERIAFWRLVEEKCDLARQRFGLARERRHHQDRTGKPKRGLAQHQRPGRALEPHQRKAARAAAVQPRPKFARRFFQTPFQIDLSTAAISPRWLPR